MDGTKIHLATRHQTSVLLTEPEGRYFVPDMPHFPAL